MQYSKVEQIRDNYLYKITDFKDKAKTHYRDLKPEDIKERLKKVIVKEKIRGKKYFAIPYNKLWFNTEEWECAVVENNKWKYSFYVWYGKSHQTHFIF